MILFQNRDICRRALLSIFTVATIHLIYDQRLFFSYTHCKFSQEETAPTPVVLMSLGRSGSSATWNTISRLTGVPSVAYEYTGQTREKSDKFFAEIDKRIGSRFAILKLCHIQGKAPKGAGVIGFQWKPYHTMLEHKYAIGALKEMGESLDHPIRVIYLTRNPLDRRASNLRHNAHASLSAHCAINDKECVEQHQEKAGEGLYMPTGRDLREWLKTDTKWDTMIRNALSINGIRYIPVSYEKLYNSESAEEWMKIFRFLGRGPGQGLTMQDVRESFSTAATSVNRNDTITNFKQVKSTLTGTQFEHLLYS